MARAVSFLSGYRFEYIFRLAHSVIICFRDSATAQRVLQAEANTTYSARTPAPQVWKSRGPPQGWSCKNCNQEISGQPACRGSHERLCPEQEDYFKRQEKYAKKSKNIARSVRRALSQSRRRTRVVTFERGTTSPTPIIPMNAYCTLVSCDVCHVLNSFTVHIFILYTTNKYYNIIL